MVTVSRPLLTALALSCAAGFGVTGHLAAQSTLPKGSPFTRPAGAVDPASAPSETMQFAAVRTLGKHTEIDLYDTQGKKNHWIPLGETVDGMTAVSYDARRDQVVVTIGGVNKTLNLRMAKGAVPGNPGIANPTAASFATPPAPAVQPVAVAPVPAPAKAPEASDASTAAPTAAAAAPAQPAAPLSVVRQEEEARMLVSDLLEIGMAQRKAYEDKQKQGAGADASATAASSAQAAPVAATPPGS